MKKPTVRKWTLCPFSDTKTDINPDFSVFICIDKIKEELKTAPLLYNLYSFIRFKKKVLFCCFFGII